MSSDLIHLRALCAEPDARRQYITDTLVYQGHNVQKQMFNHKVHVNLIIHFGQPWVRVLAAHYDVVSDVQGANDNGAAVAQLLTLAGRLKAEQYQGPLTIVFFDQEEQLANGWVEQMGSYALGEYLAFEGHHPDIFLVFDVTGIGDTLVVSDVPGLGPHQPILGLQAMEIWLKHSLGTFVPRMGTPPSDNYGLRRHGVQSLLLTVLPANLRTAGIWDRIHSSADSVESIQPSTMDYMARVLDSLAHADVTTVA